MCGRKTLSMSKREIIEQLMVDEWQVEDYTPIKSYFLGDQDEISKKADAVAAQGRKD